MRVTTSMSEAMVLCWKMVDSSFEVGIREYLRGFFTSDSKMESDTRRDFRQGLLLLCVKRKAGNQTELLTLFKILND